jgi:phosphatidyl-N-methylethanolamine N-methyltransferase
MRPWLLLTAAIGLSLERAAYVFIARAPARFQRLCRHPAVARFGEPVAIVHRLLYGFKALQFSLFAAWCLVHGDGRPLPAAADPVVLGLGAAAVVAGQILNWSVFYRLRIVGVFYGDRLGHQVPWCHGFPFSLGPHPQYVGVVLTIWGFFFGMRFPHDDWFALPALETLYYALGAQLEHEPGPAYREAEQARIGGRLT